MDITISKKKICHHLLFSFKLNAASNQENLHCSVTTCSGIGACCHKRSLFNDQCLFFWPILVYVNITHYNCIIVHFFNHSLSLFLKDTGLSLLSQMHALSCCGSGLMLLQVLLYWNKCKTNHEKVQKDKAE